MVIIIGAGPAGLKLSKELTARGVENLILEKEDVPAASFRAMPGFLKMLSPWLMNFLDEDDRDLMPEGLQPSARQMHEYFSAYARKHAIPIEFHTEVSSIAETSSELVIHTNKGERKAQKAVWATGMWSHPYFSVEKKMLEECSIPIFHFADCPTEKFNFKGKTVLIVGGRLSAGQIMREIDQLTEGEVKFVLSLKHPLQFSPAWIQRLPAKLLLHVEDIGASFFKRGELPVLMEADLKRYIKEKAVEIRGMIKGLKGHEVIFENDQKSSPDVIIFATGFRFKPGSAGGRNIHLIGAPNLRDFRSRFLRGIRRDAVWLADRIEQELKASRK